MAVTIAPASERGRQVLNQNKFFALATVDENGPWTACLAYTVGPPACLYFFSERASRHGSAILAGNTRVAGVIYDSRATPDEVESIQFSGRGEVAHDEASIRHVLEAGAKCDGNSPPTGEEVKAQLKKSSTLLFRITIEDAYVLDQALFASKGIDAREPVGVAEVFASE